MPRVANPARARCSAPISAGAFERAGENAVREPTGGLPRQDSLVAAEAAQGEGLERGQLTVRPHHVVIGDRDRRGTAGL